MSTYTHTHHHLLEKGLEVRRSCESLRTALFDPAAAAAVMAEVLAAACPGFFKYCRSTSSSRGTSPLHCTPEVLWTEDVVEVVVVVGCWALRTSSTTISSSNGWVNCPSSAGRLSLMLSVIQCAYTRWGLVLHPLTSPRCSSAGLPECTGKLNKIQKIRM